MRFPRCFVKNFHTWKLTASGKLKQVSISSDRYFCDKSTSQFTIDDVKSEVMRKMGVAKGYAPEPPDRSPLLKYLPRSQDDLPVRSMKDSFGTALIPLGTNLDLQMKYTTLMGNVRKGRMLEDLDIFAAWISIKHIYDPKNDQEICPYTIVTASVDETSFETWICKVTNDMRISGEVEMVGKSSMEVCVWLESFVEGEWKLYTKSYFTMVARNSTNTASAIVNKLKPNGPVEEAKYLQASERLVKRRTAAKQSLIKSYPEELEQKAIHDKFQATIDLNDPTLKSRILPHNSVWMESTQVSSVIFPHPEDKNAHNTVFGGLLMRHSLELSYIIAINFGKQLPPSLINISDIAFKAPVPIDSVIKMTGMMVHTELNFAQITVYTEVLNVFTSKTFTTNTFHYTYQFQHTLPEVLPLTYQEAMMWLEGRRYFYNSVGRKK
ncbi:hypothetical protein O3M35_012337 [Rhynocoris fuscipes]|uniref:HotDog ACOT-type domain-containing protein n=1 Tax=Rhynocoris fuscipes TaxID=488301 RepID=A0AAW1CT59_9HEMI